MARKEQTNDRRSKGTSTRKQKATNAEAGEDKAHEVVDSGSSKKRKTDEPAGRQPRQQRQRLQLPQLQQALEKAENPADRVGDQRCVHENGPEHEDEGSEVYDPSDEEDEEDEDDEGSPDDFDSDDCLMMCELCDGVVIDSSTRGREQWLQEKGWNICCCMEEALRDGVCPGLEEWQADEDEDEDEDEVDDDDEYCYDDYGWGGLFGGFGGRFGGGRSYDVVFGMAPGTPTRAAGSVPEVLPTDTAITDGVYGRLEKDGSYSLFGGPLGNAPKLLERIFGFKRPRRDVLLWQSALPLHSHEWRYITDALAAPRLRPLLQHGQRVKDPLPENKVVPFPHRLRPKDIEDEPLRGPFVSTKTDKSWNRGRLFFSTFKSAVDSSFIWADGVKAMEPEAQQSFADEFGF